MTFHGKKYIYANPFNSSKHLIVVCLPLKRFRKSLEVLERPLKFSLWLFIALEKSFSLSVKSVSKKQNFKFPLALKDLESV